jgi:predicted nuclease of predicted toxin-antitoxin system
MKLLLDQDVYELTARFLTNIGHDVVKVSELGMARSSDEDNLAKALDLGRIFVTRDRDFGNLVFVRGIQAGVIFLRILPSNGDEVHEELQHVLETYDYDDLKRAFIVVESRRHRHRKIG